MHTRWKLQLRTIYNSGLVPGCLLKPFASLRTVYYVQAKIITVQLCITTVHRRNNKNFREFESFKFKYFGTLEPRI